MKTEKFNELRETSMSELELEVEAMKDQTDVASLKAKKSRNSKLLHGFLAFVAIGSIYRHLEVYGYLERFQSDPEPEILI